MERPVWRTIRKQLKVKRKQRQENPAEKRARVWVRNAKCEESNVKSERAKGQRFSSFGSVESSPAEALPTLARLP